jgi:hypothetical protein
MEIVVIKTYTDKDTKNIMMPGKKAEYSDERANELISKGFVEAVEKEIVIEKKVRKSPKKNEL